MEGQRKERPVLLLDAGNALFKAVGISDAPSVERAHFILKKMGLLGTAAMAPGLKDLNWGAAQLKKAADEAKVPLVSSNLVDGDGKPLFAPSVVLVVGGTKVAVVGVSPAGELGPGLRGRPVVAAVTPELRRLRGKVELVVVLGAIPYADALQLSQEAKGNLDVIVQSSDSILSPTVQRGDGNLLVRSGERGRMVGKLTLGLSGKGPFVDLEEADREKQLAQMLEGQLAEVRRRVAQAKDPAVASDLKKTAEMLENSRLEHLKAAAPAQKGARTVRLEWVQLGTDIADDPVWKAEVDRIDPPAQRAH